MDLISILFLVGPVAAVPLGLTILHRQTLSAREQTFLRVARWVHPFAALGVVASFAFMPGRPAALLTLSWLLFGGFLGLIALLRLLNGGWRFPTPLCYTAALIYLPIGAAWLFASRAGINPMGFGEPIVLLTAVHFHFSGFAASILAGEVTRRTEQHHWASRWIALGATLGTPLIATGFVFVPFLKMIAILFFGSTLATLAAVQIGAAQALEPAWARLALRISSGSILLGMLLAGIYGITDYLGWPALSIPQMAHFHGTLNAFGFTLCGLIGWALSSGKERRL